MLLVFRNLLPLLVRSSGVNELRKTYSAQLRLWIPPDLMDKLILKSEDCGLSVSEVVRQILVSYFLICK